MWFVRFSRTKVKIRGLNRSPANISWHTSLFILNVGVGLIKRQPNYFTLLFFYNLSWDVICKLLTFIRKLPTKHSLSFVALFFLYMPHTEFHWQPAMASQATLTWSPWAHDFKCLHIHWVSLVAQTGNSPPALFQYSCLGNPMDRRAWWARVHGDPKSWMWQSD